MKLIYFIMFTLILFPYHLLGQEFAGVIISVIALITILLRKKQTIQYNKTYFYLLLGLIFSGVISLVFTHHFTKSLSGLSIYINGILFYILFTKYHSQSEKINQSIVYTLSASSLVVIIFQGIFYKIRIDGNIGYANTYGLLLLIGLYLNETIKKKTLYDVTQLILMMGMLYTNSRYTLFFLVVFIILDTVYKFNRADVHSLLNIFMAITGFLLMQAVGLAMLFILPIILYTLYTLLNIFSNQWRQKIVILLVLLSIPGVFLVHSNLSERLKNISFTAGVLQERLIYYQDVISYLLKNPLGAGINSFEYSQYTQQTAFYDVKYVHNSILQIGYDMGWIGMLFFLAVGVVGLYLLMQSKHIYIKYYILLYISIYLHSMLDFDFSYPIIMAIVVMMIAFTQDKDSIVEYKIKPFLLPSAVVLVLSVYLIVVNSLDRIGDYLNGNEHLNEARKIYNINKVITYKDPDPYFKLAEISKKESALLNNSQKLNESIHLLKIAEKINPNDPRIIGNLAFTYQELGDVNETIRYYERFIQIEKFYSKIYQEYYRYLKIQYAQTQNFEFNNKIHALKQTYTQNLNQLNPRAKYLENQLPNQFEAAMEEK